MDLSKKEWARCPLFSWTPFLEGRHGVFFPKKAHKGGTVPSFRDDRAAPAQRRKRGSGPAARPRAGTATTRTLPKERSYGLSALLRTRSDWSAGAHGPDPMIGNRSGHPHACSSRAGTIPPPRRPSPRRHCAGSPTARRRCGGELTSPGPAAEPPSGTSAAMADRPPFGNGGSTDGGDAQMFGAE